jgi:hypothetical protein
MATTTPVYNWPVPTSTDYVKDGATAIESLGDAIDASMSGKPKASGTYTANGTLTTTYASYITISLTTSTRPVYVFFSATGNNANSGAQQFFDVRAQVDGVTIGNEMTENRLIWVSGASARFNTAHAFLLTPTAGTRSFTLQAKAGATGAVQLPFAQLVVFEI